jgi:formate--tetrahydrofolate ligase
VENLKKHIENIHRFGLPVVVAINHFSTDTEAEIQCIQDKCAYLSVKIVKADHWAKGGAGAEELARAVVDVVENTKTDFSLLYPDTCTLWQKVGIICREIYGATDVLADKKPASATCPSAWPRRSIRSRQISYWWADRRTSTCRYET